MAYLNTQSLSEPRPRMASKAIRAVPHSTKTFNQTETIYARVGKRLFDVCAIVLALPIIVPVMAVLWVIAALDGGNAFYSQMRVGRDGKSFRCWKLRTMVPDADAVLQRMIEEDPQVADEWERTQKLENDPRITRFGNLLRRSSLDELPQLLNVLRGDMSLVGPRPFTEDQKAIYDAADSKGRYYSVRPGITGLWQVKCRNRGEFADRVSYDRAYAENLSLVQDIKLLVGTLGVVARATGK